MSGDLNTSEFDLIRHYFAAAKTASDVVLGIGDDAAIVRANPALDWVVTTDTLIAGVHFPDSATAADIAHKTLAVNVSDIAAMAATPRYATLALSLPKLDHQWLQEFSRTLHQQLALHSISLIGGDTTRSAVLSLTLTLIGEVERGKAVRRDAAQPGDVIAVTGTLGDAGLGLALALGQCQLDDKATTDYFLARLHRPLARANAAAILRDYAHAAIDISDGFWQDLGHVLNRSQCGASLELDKLPISTALRNAVTAHEALDYALYAGDDYELLFTAPAQHWSAVQSQFAGIGLMVTAVGVITAEPGLRACHDGQPFAGQRNGYDHFI